MQRKKSKIITVIVAILVLATVIAAICAVRWYKRSALAIALDIGIAISERDADEVFDSVVSSDRAILGAFMTLLAISEERALGLIFPEGSSEDVKSVRLVDYVEGNGVATVEIKIVYQNGTEQPLTLTFVKEDGEWRLSVSKLITDILDDM